MVDLVSLLKLLKELLPEEVYRNLIKVIMELFGTEDRIAYARMRQIIMEWVRANYPELERLIKLILDKARPASVPEGAAYVTLSGVVEAGAVLASGPLAILAGLLLPASKWWGWPGIDLTGWWRDPCDELFSRICEAYTEHIEQRGSFPTGFVSGSPDVMNLLSSVGHIITLCAQFLRDCPNHGRKGTIQFIQQTATGYQQQYWNF